MNGNSFKTVLLHNGNTKLPIQGLRKSHFFKSISLFLNALSYKSNVGCYVEMLS